MICQTASPRGTALPVRRLLLQNWRRLLVRNQSRWPPIVAAAPSTLPRRVLSRDPHVRTHEHRTCPNAFTRISRAWGAFSSVHFFLILHLARLEIQAKYKDAIKLKPVSILINSCSPSLPRDLPLSLSSIPVVCFPGMAGHPCPTLRATSLSFQGEPSDIGKG